MAGPSFKVSIKTPTAVMFDGDVDKLGVLTKDGKLTIYPGHANLVALLDLGIVSLYIKDKLDEVFCFEGLMKIENGDVLILTEDAKPPSEELLQEIEAAIKVAKEGLADKDKQAISVEGLLKAEMELRYRLTKKK